MSVLLADVGFPWLLSGRVLRSAWFHALVFFRSLLVR
jgi:hypothetical protein